MADPKLVTSPVADQNRFVQDVRINLIQHIVLLRNSAAIDEAFHFHAVLCHAIENHACVKRRSFNRRKQLIRRGAGQVPAERDTS